MNDASASVATAERPLAPSQPKPEALPQKVNSKEVRQFGEMAEVAVNDRNKRPEAFAGITGWMLMGRVNRELQEKQGQVFGLLENKKITQEKADDFLQKIGKIGAQAQENIIPLLKNLDGALKKDSSAISPFMRDLNYHYLKNDIKRLEGSDDPNAKLELGQLKGDLTKSEKERGEIKPEGDEIIKFALTLRGEKGLPEKFKDAPLEAIDDFFQHQLKKIVKSEKTRVQMAQRLGVAPDDLTNLVAVYEQGSKMDRSITDLNNEINPKKNKLAMAGGMLGLFLALQTWLAMKKESSSGGQQMG